MGCAGSRSNKVNEVAVKPKAVEMEKGTAKKGSAEVGKSEGKENKVSGGKASGETVKVEGVKSDEVKRSEEVKVKEGKSEENLGVDEGFAVIRTVSSKPGFVLPVKATSVLTGEEQAAAFLASVYLSARTQLQQRV